jgi:hypothetical protein
LSTLALLAASGFLSANSTAGQVPLAWDAVSGATGYRVHYGTATGTYSANVDAKTATSYTVANLIDGTRYFFAVQAYNSTTTSAYSTELAYTVPLPPGGGGGGSPPPGGGGSGGSTAVKPNLVAAYGFEESTGLQAIDASGFGNHGTISGARRVATTQFGNVLEFNGSNNWVTVNGSASLDLATGMTLEAWVYLTGWNGWGTVVMKEQTGGFAYSLYANADADLPSTAVAVGGYYGDLTVEPQVPANTWTHLAATYDGSTQKLYVNGVLAGSRQQTGAITLSSGALRIGGNAVWGNEYFTGYIDEVRVYNRALTQAEIAQDSTTAAVGLVVSTSSNRSNPVPLNGLAVSGNLYVSYVLISPTAAVKPVTQVQFWLDDPNPSSPTGSPVMTQRRSPFDFAGTRVDGTANPFSTTGLSKGIHTITARVTLSDGTALPFIKGTFTLQ